jgi:DNA-binding LacI/PurR family transcriptional regulator
MGAEMLLRQINSEAPAIEHRVLPAGLDVRASTAPPPGI